MEEVENNKLKLYNLQEIKDIFYKKKIKNVILFSQARSGSTFVSNVLSNELGFKNNFFSEKFFINKHFSYIKKFVEKHDNFFINTNEFVFKRTNLKKENTLHIYLQRNYLDIITSYEKAKKKEYYLGWEEMYEKYKIFFPNLKNIKPIPLFNHKVWESQIDSFENAFTLSYESFKNHPKFINKDKRLEKITSLKQIEENKDGWLEYEKNMKIQEDNFENKLKFNFFQKNYFRLRRALESRKKSMKNY